MDAQPKTRILVAEDSSTVAHVIRYNLESAGFTVTVARDGMEALTMAQENTFDLVMADEQMPRLSGRDLCRRLRAHPDYAATPLIFVTSKRFEIESDIINSFGPATAVIGKPFSPRALLCQVESALSGSTVA